MKPLLALSTSVSLNLPNSPPAYSRMPPDGHEFPHNYQELVESPNANATATAELNAPSAIASDTLLLYAPRKPVYTDVFNEAKLLDVERAKMPEKESSSVVFEPPPVAAKNRSSWRNDERSERSVKDKIAMFSNAIQKSSPSSPSPSCGGLIKCRSEDVVDYKPCKAFSKSVFAVNNVGRAQPLPATAHTFKSKATSCERSHNVLHPTTDDVNINRTRSSIDLTLFSSSCSSAYSSCSPDSSLSPMSSPSYTIGSSSTLPRKQKSQVAAAAAATTTTAPATITKRTAATTHAALTRAISFTGTTPPLHTRSQSFDLLQVQSLPTASGDERKDSLTTLIEQRRRTMSKLRGLVIPEKTCVANEAHKPLKPIVDLPEIKSKEVLVSNGICGGVNANAPAKLCSRNNETSGSNNLVDGGGSWKSFNSVDIPKYSPAFKRKTLTVYGVSNSSTSSLSSSLNSSREELRDSHVKKTPIKPPRTSYNNQLVYGPTVYKSQFKQPSSPEIVETKTNDDNNNNNSNGTTTQISRNDILKLQEDSDNDSAVSSSRSSLCQEYSPPSSPSPDAVNEHTIDSPSRSSSRTLRRTLSSETNVSLTSSVSTLTSGSSQASSNTSAEDRRVLKPESVEAINRKNVLSSAKYSCGQDFKVGSPLIKDVYDGQQRFGDGSAGVVGGVWKDEVKISFLEIQDGDESDCSSVKENSSSADTDEALDKSLDSTDSLCGNYRSDYCAALEKKDLLLEKSRALLAASSRREERLFGGEGKKSVSDMRKAFEEDADTKTTHSTLMKSTLTANHLRMSSTDSTTSDESFPSAGVHGLNMSLVKEQQFGSITSLASSTSLISQQELQQLIDEANQTLEETAGGGEHDLMVVILHRDTIVSSIGITLAGGADYEAKEITVHKILVGSPADKDGRIQRGDRILSINGRNMKGVTHREALSILKAPRPEVVLVVSRWKTDGSNATNPSPPAAEDPLATTFRSTVRPPRIPEIATDCDTKKLPNSIAHSDVSKATRAQKGPTTSVALVKEGGGLGFSLEGGKDSPLGDLPLTIKKIFTGGCAAKSGSLAAGDELISLNGIDVTSMSRTEAWNMMKRLADGQVVLNIRRAPLES